ncbi:YjcZ family sporulation protein [Bacillus sp. FJAT-50079]|nr:YjcZ family sporulation protein [Bacillus sp. FJAT-50079]MBS4207494.1 YjcZ family sporulation protein [Bacillus sp. FJAT-50079]
MGFYGGGCGYGGYGGGFDGGCGVGGIGSGFALIVVLFILLIIVASAFIC